MSGAQKVWTDRSRILAYRRCPRMRFIEYHMGGTGLVPARKSLALVVGGMAHTGLARMLDMAMTFGLSYPENLSIIEDDGVAAGLAAWDAYVAANGGVEVESSERVWELPARQAGGGVTSAADAGLLVEAGSVVPTPVDFNMPLGIDLDELNLPAGPQPLTDRAAFDLYTQQEQRALLEGMLRAYARRRLRPLLEEYEVLEVEREGEWQLAQLSEEDCTFNDGYVPAMELWFASRPDALLLHRESGSLHLLSYKTTGAVDLRKLADIQHDDQGLSEGVEIERRLREAWQSIHWNSAGSRAHQEIVSPRLVEWLKSLASPPRIDAIRYEFLLKGERWKDKGLSSQVGFEARSQKSPLVKAYQYQGKDASLQGKWCWAWDYEKPDGSGKGSLNWQNWKAQPIWQTYGVKEWIDLLDSGKAQQVGLAGDALEAQFYPPQLVYRSEDDLRDWIEQVEAQEIRVAQGVQYVKTIEGLSERTLMNIHFPMNRSACEYPGRCAYADKDHGPCYGPAHARGVEAMLASGKYVRREPNHPREREGAAWQGQR